jgi:hypothetical protein
MRALLVVVLVLGSVAGAAACTTFGAAGSADSGAQGTGLDIDDVELTYSPP